LAADSVERIPANRGVVNAFLRQSRSQRLRLEEGGGARRILRRDKVTGIGGQLGIESCVPAATDAMEMAGRAPHVKTWLELDALAYKFTAERFLEVAGRAKEHLAADKVEVIGGTYGQPLGAIMHCNEDLWNGSILGTWEDKTDMSTYHCNVR